MRAAGLADEDLTAGIAAAVSVLATRSDVPSEKILQTCIRTASDIPGAIKRVKQHLFRAAGTQVFARERKITVQISVSQLFPVMEPYLSTDKKAREAAQRYSRSVARRVEADIAGAAVMGENTVSVTTTFRSLERAGGKAVPWDAHRFMYHVCFTMAIKPMALHDLLADIPDVSQPTPPTHAPVPSMDLDLGLPSDMAPSLLLPNTGPAVPDSWDLPPPTLSLDDAFALFMAERPTQ